jgi:glucokinase
VPLKRKQLHEDDPINRNAGGIENRENSAMQSNHSGRQVITEEPSQEHRDRGFVIGVDIGGTNLRLALADCSGIILGRWTCSTAGIREPQAIVRRICEGVNALLLERGGSTRDLRAIAAGAPGITDSEKGLVLATSYLMGWKDVPLRDLLEAEFGVPAFVDNDVNMAAFGEYSAGSASGVHDFVFLAIGTGVGAGIVLNGEVYRGHGWLAGEVGYMLVPGTGVTAIEEDRPGALEEIVGGEGIRSHWQSRWSKGGTTLPQEATATQIFDASSAGDALAQELLGLVSRTLAYAIYNISLVLNCPLFVLGGGVGLHPALREATGAVLKQINARVQPSLAPSSLGAEAQMNGAVFRAIAVAKKRPLGHECGELHSCVNDSANIA